ncbi:DUF1801 domain-containing protein [Acholeplasma vituli]|uniref:DUF1801 domain-containing protein n=1 Tax=Paracholeplasma vituli TaxID=69473 RepID=A0ABT2PWT5_9MOLU|nr:DUF1801 domain-containing protein [Paracholeplasma vituli]MCU0104794.1 DUF1801 domain-containing protein [Paracholeplasma vituli]
MNITNVDVRNYIDSLDPKRKPDVLYLIDLMSEITGLKPKLWGTIVGFGKLHYQYKTGHSGDMPIIGLASRKQAITLYLSFEINQYEELSHLGKVTYGKSCLYIKTLKDVDLDVLRSLIIKTTEDALKMDFITRIE